METFKRILPKVIALITVTIFLSSIAIATFYIVYADKRYKIYYNVKVYGEDVAYYKVFHDNDKTKLVVVMKNGEAIVKDLPLDVGVHESQYWAYLGVGAISLIFLILAILHLADSIHYELKREYDP